MRSALARATPVVTTNVKHTTQRRRSVAVRASKVRDDRAAARRSRKSVVDGWMDGWVTRGCRRMMDDGCVHPFANGAARRARVRARDARAYAWGISHENRSWTSSRAFDRGLRAVRVAIASMDGNPVRRI